MNNIKLKKSIKYIVILIAVICTAVIFKKSAAVREIICLLVVSLFITYMLKPFYMKLVDLEIGRSTSAIILVSGSVLVCVCLFMLIIPCFFNENMNIKYIMQGIQNLTEQIYKNLKPGRGSGILYRITDTLYYKIQEIVMGISGKIYEILMKLSGILVYVVVIPIVVYYFLMDGRKISHGILNFLPIRTRSRASNIVRHIDIVLGRYIFSQVLLSFLIGIVTFVILLILKVDFPFILSLINAFFNIIPYFGPIFGAIPAVLVGFMKSPRTAIYIMVCLYVLQQIEGNILSPKVTAESVSMHPLSVIFLIILGEKAAGFVGMVAVIPIAAVVKIIYKDLTYYIF